jgi:signal peptidase
MDIRRSLSTAVEAALVILVFSLVLGVVLGQPVLLSYVETGSMEPTLNPGDRFVAVTTADAGMTG